MKNSILRANRADTSDDRGAIRGDAKSHAAAMTSAFSGGHHQTTFRASLERHRPLALCRLPSLSKQDELRGIARRLGKPEMSEGMRGQQPSARGALDEALLDQERLDDLLDGVARLGKRRSDRLDADGTAAVILRDRREVTAVHRIQSRAIHLQFRERAIGG